MSKPAKTMATAVLLLLAGGCASHGTRPDPAYAPPRPAEPKPAVLNNGAIYQEGFGLRLFEDIRARQVGDLLTIHLLESTNASKQATTSTKKENDVQLDNPTLLGAAGSVRIGGSLGKPFPTQSGAVSNLEVTANTQQEFSGAGSSSQSNSLKGSITVMVSEVLPNGNLIVRGEKIIALNEGDEFVRLSGIVRAQDIRPDNSVLSTQVANARISYGGNGALADANSHGWLSRFFLKLWPF
jgi:flagellar L-ring protein FlgH